MTHAANVISGYAVTALAVVVYASWVLRRNRRIGRELGIDTPATPRQGSAASAGSTGSVEPGSAVSAGSAGSAASAGAGTAVTGSAEPEPGA